MIEALPTHYRKVYERKTISIFQCSHKLWTFATKGQFKENKKPVLKLETDRLKAVAICCCAPLKIKILLRLFVNVFLINLKIVLQKVNSLILSRDKRIRKSPFWQLKLKLNWDNNTKTGRTKKGFVKPFKYADINTLKGFKSLEKLN